MSAADAAPVAKPDSFVDIWPEVNRIEALLEAIEDRLLGLNYLENRQDREKTNAACLFAQIAREVADSLASKARVR